jgi:dephospho-CoA kinase
MKIYGVTGMPLSGKTSVAEMMEDEGFTLLDMGEVVRIEMEKRDIPAEKTGAWVNEMREEHGEDAIAQLSIPYLKEVMEEKQKIVITGMRSWEEKKKFEKETEAEIEVIAVWASRKTRKQRRKERQREEDIKGDEFHDRDTREIQNGVGKLIALSDQLIKNDEISEKELKQEVEGIVSK